MNYLCIMNSRSYTLTNRCLKKFKFKHRFQCRLISYPWVFCCYWTCNHVARSYRITPVVTWLVGWWFFSKTAPRIDFQHFQLWNLFSKFSSFFRTLQARIKPATVLQSVTKVLILAIISFYKLAFNKSRKLTEPYFWIIFFA